jgi:xanthine dehydrogenase iron-sulfur cluster and FAD-binding subunit A
LNCFPAEVAVQSGTLRIKTLKAAIGADRGTHPLYLKPKTLSDAVDVLATSGGQILAGGTDFYPALGDRLPQGDVVDITGLREIRGIITEDEYIRIGGLTTWTEIVRTPLPQCFDALKSVAMRTLSKGGSQVRLTASTGQLDRRTTRSVVSRPSIRSHGA